MRWRGEDHGREEGGEGGEEEGKPQCAAIDNAIGWYEDYEEHLKVMMNISGLMAC